MARLVCRLDRKQEFRIAPVQSPLGRALLAHYGLDADDPVSWLYLIDGRAYGELDAVARAGRRLGGLGLIAAPLGWAPRAIPTPLCAAGCSLDAVAPTICERRARKRRREILVSGKAISRQWNTAFCRKPYQPSRRNPSRARAFCGSTSMARL